MNKTLIEARDYVEALAAAPSLPDLNRFVVPPFTLLRDVHHLLANTEILIGAQNMHWEDEGAWTGEISGPMLIDCGVGLVELGHSERRMHFGETDEIVGLKVAAALRHGLTPLVCVGENMEQKSAGKENELLAHQVEKALKHAPRQSEVLFAYEPVWAIGDGGVPASADYANEKHRWIGEIATRHLGTVPSILYGGSVTPHNCTSFVSMPHIDGVFVGRSAWTVDGFIDILNRCAGAISK